MLARPLFAAAQGSEEEAWSVFAASSLLKPLPAWLRRDLAEPLRRAPPVPAAAAASPTDEDKRRFAAIEADMDVSAALGLLSMDTDPASLFSSIGYVPNEEPLQPLTLVLARFFMERRALLDMLATLFKMSTTESAAASTVRDLLRQGCAFNVLELVNKHTSAIRALLTTRDAVCMGLRVSALLAERRILGEIVFIASYYSRLNAREVALVVQLACILSDPGHKPMPSTSQSIMLAPTTKVSEFVFKARSMSFETLYLCLLSLLSTLAGDDAQRMQRDVEDVVASSPWGQTFGDALINDSAWLHEGARGVVLLAWGLFLAAGKQSRVEDLEEFLRNAFERRALAFVRLVLASPEFESDPLVKVLGTAVFTSMIRTLEANRTFSSSGGLSDDSDGEHDPVDLLKPRVQLLDMVSNVALSDSLEDLLACVAACARIDSALAEYMWAEKADVLEALLERMPSGEEKPYSLRQALLALMRALAAPNPQCAACCLSVMRNHVGQFHRLIGTLVSLFNASAAPPQVPTATQELVEAWATLLSSVAQTADLAEAVVLAGGEVKWSTDGILSLLGCELTSALKGGLLNLIAALCASPRLADEVQRSRIKLIPEQWPVPPRSPDLVSLLEQREAHEQTYPVTRGFLRLALARPSLLGVVVQHVWLRIDARSFAYAGERWHVAALCLRVLLAAVHQNNDALLAELKQGGPLFARVGSILQQAGSQLAQDVAAARRARKLDWFLASATAKSLTTQRDLKRAKTGTSSALVPFWQHVEAPLSQGLLHFPSTSSLLDSGLGEAVAAWLLETSTGRPCWTLDEGDALLLWRLETVRSCLSLLCAIESPSVLVLLRAKVPLLSRLLSLPYDAEVRRLCVVLLDRLATGSPTVFSSGVTPADVAWLLLQGGQEEDRRLLLKSLVAHAPTDLLANPMVLQALAALTDSDDALHALFIAANASPQAAARVERVWETCLDGTAKAWALRGLAVVARTKPDSALAALKDGSVLVESLNDPALHGAWRAVVEAVPGVDAMGLCKRALNVRPLSEDVARGTLVLMSRLKLLSPDDAHQLMIRSLCAVADTDQYAQPASLACAAACVLLVIEGTRERRAKLIGRPISEKEAMDHPQLSPMDRAVAVANVEAVEARGQAAMQRLGYAAVEGASPMLRWVAGAALATLLSLAKDRKDFAQWAQQRGVAQGLASRPDEDTGLLDILAREGVVRLPVPAPDAGSSGSAPRVDAPPRFLAVLAPSDLASTMRALKRMPGLDPSEADAKMTVLALATCAKDRAAFEKEGLGAKWDREVVDKALVLPTVRTAALLYMARRHALPPLESDCAALANCIEAMAAEPVPDVKALEGAVLLLHAKMQAMAVKRFQGRLVPSALDPSRPMSPLERLAKDRGGVLQLAVTRLGELR